MRRCDDGGDIICPSPPVAVGSGLRWFAGQAVAAQVVGDDAIAPKFSAVDLRIPVQAAAKLARGRKHLPAKMTVFLRECEAQAA